ncbi:MAG TPA: haloacid dehalogenase type II [Jatrophihabitantaceae bacterium]|nr:haloacid dehalogenase type II [Jatrophihabitantaceae bacterium]
MAASRPDVIVFDVVETLASLDAVRDRLVAAGQPGHVLESWFSRLTRDGMALTLAGGFAPFLEVAASALAVETSGALSAEQVNEVVAGFGETGPQPDAVAAVTAAAEAGVRVFALSNGSAESTTRFLERAGMADHVEQVLSIDQVRAWKPAPQVYRLACDAAGLPPGRLALVAVHAWDVHGARQAGMSTGWCPRLEQVAAPAFDAADVVADTLDAVVRALVALPAP